MQYIIFDIMEGEGNGLSRQKGKKKKKKKNSFSGHKITTDDK